MQRCEAKSLQGSVQVKNDAIFNATDNGQKISRRRRRHPWISSSRQPCRGPSAISYDMDEYRSLASAKHARYLAQTLAAASVAPVVESKDAEPFTPRPTLRLRCAPQSIRDQISCLCVGERARCSTCLGCVLAGIDLPQLGACSRRCALALPTMLHVAHGAAIGAGDLAGVSDLEHAALVYFSVFDESSGELRRSHELSATDKRALASLGFPDQRAFICAFDESCFIFNGPAASAHFSSHRRLLSVSCRW